MARSALLVRRVFHLPLLLNLFGLSIILFFAFEALSSGTCFWKHPYFLRVLRFTVLQAALASLLVLCVSLFVAHVLDRHRSSSLLKGLKVVFAFPFFIPTLIGCLSLLLVFGRSGFIAKLFPIPSFMYGLGGILLVHLFYYVPFALKQWMRLLANRPAEYERLADTLFCKGRDRFRILLWPWIRQEIFPLFVLVCLHCFRSFTTILLLGGGPKSTTLEVALFHAVHFDFDLSRAAWICLAQWLCTTSLICFAEKVKRPIPSAVSSGLMYAPQRSKSFLDWVCISLLSLFFLLPLLAIAQKGIVIPEFFLLLRESFFWQALGVSLWIGLCTFFIANLLVWPLLFAKIAAKPFRLASWVSDIPASFSLIFSPLIIGLFLYLFLQPSLTSKPLFLLFLSFFNALAFLPNIYRVLSPVFSSQREQFDPLCGTLNIQGWPRFRWIDWAAMKPALGYTLAICLIFSLGEARGILFFSQEELPTFVTLIYRKMKLFQFDTASAISAWLVLLSLGLFFLIQKGFGKWRFGS